VLAGCEGAAVVVAGGVDAGPGAAEDTAGVPDVDARLAAVWACWVDVHAATVTITAEARSSRLPTGPWRRIPAPSHIAPHAHRRGGGLPLTFPS
jgi:hypothetical protein